MESPGHDARVSSLEKVAVALGLPRGGMLALIRTFFLEDPASFRSASLRILTDGFDSWPVHLFDSVDALRKAPDPVLVQTPAVADIEPRLQALIASTVEALCAETAIDVPSWCLGICPLETPWFVSGIENLKASALVESPVHFRRRNIFVLANFLKRA